MNTKDYNVFLKCCLPEKKNEIREVTNVSVMSQNAKSVRSVLQTYLSPFHTASSSEEPQSSLSHIITILQEGHKRDSPPCVLLSLCPPETQGRHLFPGETGNMQTAQCLHDQHSH